MGIPNPIFIIVMGVSGSGKSTLGVALAQKLGLAFEDGDDLHPPENVAKMGRGVPLDDADRAPWLRRIRAEGDKACSSADQDGDIDAPRVAKGLVIGCSALKKAYRMVLRGHDSGTVLTEGNPSEEKEVSPEAFPTCFIFIDGSKEELMRRMKTRTGHFMKAEMLNSQLATLEAPDPSTEEGIIVVKLEDSTEEQVRTAVAGLEAVG